MEWLSGQKAKQDIDSFVTPGSVVILNSVSYTHLVFREFQEEDCENLVMMPMHQEDLTLHGHDFFELTYITGGAAVHTLEEQECPIGSGDRCV